MLRSAIAAHFNGAHKINTQNTALASKEFGSLGYRTSVLLGLSLIYALNFIDRILIAVVSRPIIEEFNLTNFQFGLLIGLGFAIFFTLLGVPIAHYSVRFNRAKILGLSVIIWSVATIISGLAVGFVSLLIARMLLGVGQAGYAPVANSLICDYYSPIKRPGALGVFAMGSLLGGGLSYLLGGLVIQSLTWREAFIYMGAPGIFFGVLMCFAIKDSPRGYTDPTKAQGQHPKSTSLIEALKELKAKPTFWLVTFAAAAAGFAAYSFTSFQPLYIQYAFGISPAKAAIYYLALIAIAGAWGSLLSGFVIQLLSTHVRHASIWVSAITLLISVPLLIIGFVVETSAIMLLIFLLAGFFQYFYIGASFNLIQSITSLHVRATAIAVLMLLINLIGFGLGPPIAGALTDMFTSAQLQSLGTGGILTANCNPQNPELSKNLIDNCISAKAHGSRLSMILTTFAMLLASLLFFLSLKTIENDQLLGE